MHPAPYAQRRRYVVKKDTNFTFNATTNEDGLYRVVSLQPGMYRVTVEAGGFKKAVLDDVALRTGDTLAVDVAMQVGQLTESSKSRARAAARNRNFLHRNRDERQRVLYDMPLYQRYINSTLNLVPGMTSGGYAYGGDLGSYHLAGQRSGAIGIFEDGVNGNDQQGGTGTIKPLQNSVAEVKVITTVPPPSTATPRGGVISVVKKSGTNEFHGWLRGTAARGCMQHRVILRQIPNQPSLPQDVRTACRCSSCSRTPTSAARLSESTRTRRSSSSAISGCTKRKCAQVDATTPTPAMKAGDFNFPGVASNPIYDPATTRPRSADGNMDSRSVPRQYRFPPNRIRSGRAQDARLSIHGSRPTAQARTTQHGPSSNLLADEFARTCSSTTTTSASITSSTALQDLRKLDREPTRAAAAGPSISARTCRHVRRVARATTVRRSSNRTPPSGTHGWSVPPSSMTLASATTAA